MLGLSGIFGLYCIHAVENVQKGFGMCACSSLFNENKPKVLEPGETLTPCVREKWAWKARELRTQVARAPAWFSLKNRYLRRHRMYDATNQHSGIYVKRRAWFYCWWKHRIFNPYRRDWRVDWRWWFYPRHLVWKTHWADCQLHYLIQMLNSRLLKMTGMAKKKHGRQSGNQKSKRKLSK